MDENNRTILSNIRMADRIWCFLCQPVCRRKNIGICKESRHTSQKMSFQDEYQKFLESYGVEYSKEYVFKD